VTRLTDAVRTGCGEACTTRRAVVTSAAGAAALALTACGSYGGDDSAAPQAPAPEGSTGAGNGDAAEGDSTEAGGKAGNVLAKTADVPVGSGLILEEEGIVLTRPKKKTIKAFSMTCTHAGCNVTDFSDGTVTCPCHGSAFSIEDGSVVDGPAKEPLEEVEVTVKSGNILKA
jgi:Rieske Fe-S protein